MPADYNVLAPVYEVINMSDFAKRMTPRLLNFAQQNDWLGRRIYDLGCGTGASTAWFASHGYNVIGVDQSADMLAQARAVMQKQSLNPQLVEADIRNMEPAETVDLVLALDVLNEFDGIRDLESTFKCVSNMLQPGRWFIFDLHTVEGLALAGQAALEKVHDADSLAVYMATTFDYERQVYSAGYDIFMRHDSGEWSRQNASRILRGFPVQAVVSLLRRQNFEVIHVVSPRFESYELGASGEARVFVIAKRM